MPASTVKPTAWVTSTWKIIAASASTGAALVSVLSFAKSYGLIGGEDPVRQTVGAIGAAWVGVKPTADTAHAIGDTIHLAATITDTRGRVLVGASLAWSADNPDVATVNADGTVIARAPGTTVVVATIGELTARSRITVKQDVASVRIAGDSGVVVPEGERQMITARGVDARGHVVAGKQASWGIADSSVARVDAQGFATGINQGKSIVSATIDGVTAHAPISVVALPGSIDLATGGEQRVAAGGALPQAIVVRVVSRRGRPVEGALVRFRSADNLGALDPAAAYTDANGRARTHWTLSDQPGRQTLYANVENVDSALVVRAEAEPVAANTRVVALTDRQTARVGEKLSEMTGIRLTDSAGRPLADVPVSWSLLDGGSIDPAATRTDSLGEARIRWTLGAKTGTQRARAQVGTMRLVPPFLISAIAGAGAPAAATLVSGGDQQGPAGARLKRPIVVRVADAAGNPASGVELTVTPTAGSIPDGDVRTDSSGTASIPWVMGHAAGRQQLAVRVPGVERPLEVTANALPAGPANIAFVEPPTDGVIGKKLGALLAVVTDLYGNPIAEAPVVFSTTSGAATPTRVVTDAQGRARTTWLLGARVGEQALSALVRGTDVKTVLTVTTRVTAAKPSLAKPVPTTSLTKPPAAKSAPAKPAPSPAKAAPAKAPAKTTKPKAAAAKPVTKASTENAPKHSPKKSATSRAHAPR
jgi:adhesin/invasin